ncbi:CD209 antigen-like protein C isoform X1 [Nerophis lumbriciformis]|uniref:CD209 antigen-like protein C isoform X1 n=1 Tax=Nerophis lumbriciformis TaxID=546530 RepID=UPI002ADFBECC|nr:C-type lectin domain family 4 member A-like isoform X1 [Nerophis lumbriciformis]
MAAVFKSHGPQVSIEIDEYEQFPTKEHKTPPRFKRVHVVLLAFGILCVLQAVLNITLRLAHGKAVEKGDVGGTVGLVVLPAANRERSKTTFDCSEVSGSAGDTGDICGGETGDISICPQGWLLFGSSCYFVSSQRRSWDSSRQDCLQRNADLVIINSRQEQAFLTGFTKAAWIGMSDRFQEGNWIWVDGTPVNKNKLEWSPGQPDEAFGGEDCGDLRTMIDFIGLNDFNCNARSQWICEKELLL